MLTTISLLAHFSLFNQIACFFPQLLPKKQRCRIAGLPKHHFQCLLPPTMDITAVAGAVISRMGLSNKTHINLKSFTAIFWSERMSDLGLVTKSNSSLSNYILLTQSPSYSFSRTWVFLLILCCGLSQRQMHFGGEGDFCRSGHQNQLWVLEQTPYCLFFSGEHLQPGFPQGRVTEIGAWSNN